MTRPIVKSHQMPAGTVLEDRYEITAFIGAGGFAQVYEGKQLAINRTVAIKVLHARDGDEEDQRAFEERFLREAKTAAQIRHPNVVTIYDYGVCEHHPFIVMEILKGHDLHHEIKRGAALSAERVLRLFIDCLDALGDSHAQGIIHKDLKPANLYINDPGTRKETLKILDFGIARLGQESHLTSTGQLMGTPRYYAPEYIKNQIVTPALDVYQMGLILVECFTREPVVNVDDPYVCLMKHSTGNLEIPEALMAGPLGPVLKKALSLDHLERFADGHGFRDALEKIDPTKVGAVPAGDRRCQLAEISGNHQANVIPPSGSQTGPQSTNDTGGLKKSGARISQGARQRSRNSIEIQPPSPSGSRRPEQSRRDTPARPKRKARLWAGLAAALSFSFLLFLAVGVAVFMSQSEDSVETSTAPEAQAAGQMPDFQIAQATPVTIEIKVAPAGAEIFYGQKKIGVAPMFYTFESDTDDPVTLLVEAPDHEPRILKLAPSSDSVVTIALTEAQSKKTDPAAAEIEAPVMPPKTTPVEKVVEKKKRPTPPKKKPKGIMMPPPE